jgi:opacity protein-like surface antigen
MRVRQGACAVALLLCAGITHAAEPGFYFGVSVGQAKYDFETPRIAIAEPSPGGPIEVPPCCGTNPIDPVFSVAIPALWLPGDDDKDTAWAVTSGYRIGRYAAVELAYLNLGKLEANDLLLPFPPGSGAALTLHRELETTGPVVSALGILPLGDSWELFLRGGVFFADMEFTTSLAGTSSSQTQGSKAVDVGAGVQFNRREHWSARLELQRFLDVGDDDTFSNSADIDFLSLGVLYRL